VDRNLINLFPKAAALGQAALATRGLRKHGGAACAQDNRRSVTEDSSNVEATGALDVHEEGVRGLNEPLKLVLPLLVRLGGVQEILGHFVCSVL